MVVLLLSLLPEMTGPHNRKNGVLPVGMVHCLDTNVNFFKKGNICGRQEQFCRSLKIAVILWRTLLCLNEKKQKHISLLRNARSLRSAILSSARKFRSSQCIFEHTRMIWRYVAILFSFLMDATVLTDDAKNLVLKWLIS